MPLFEVSTFVSQIIWMLGVFLLLYVVVLFLIIPTFRGVFDVRSRYIAKKLEESEVLLAQSENLKQAYEEKILLIKQNNVEQLELATQEMKKISLE